MTIASYLSHRCQTAFTLVLLLVINALFSPLSAAYAATLPPVAAPVMAVVQPVIDCADLANVDLSAIGGPGSKVMSVRKW